MIRNEDIKKELNFIIYIFVGLKHVFVRGCPLISNSVSNKGKANEKDEAFFDSEQQILTKDPQNHKLPEFVSLFLLVVE